MSNMNSMTGFGNDSPIDGYKYDVQSEGEGLSVEIEMDDWEIDPFLRSLFISGLEYVHGTGDLSFVHVKVGDMKQFDKMIRCIEIMDKIINWDMYMYECRKFFG